MRIFPGVLALALFSALFSAGCALPFALDEETNESFNIHEPDLGTPPLPGETLNICSQLPFSASLSWPAGITGQSRQALELALNLSGSFEGSQGWANLTNDGDGQGLSMGLLNQTLLTGSLQPLLAEMKTQYLATLQAQFSSSHLTSLLDMVNRWEATASVTSARVRELSSLDLGADLGADYGGEFGGASAGVAEAESAQWARDNLYDSGGAFHSSWRTELTTMAESSPYVSLQIAKAAEYHSKAIELMERTGIRQVRTYLLMFDFIVQNGGLKAQDLIDYDQYVATYPTATATSRLKKLLTLRLRWVRPEFVEDVRSRKLAIIDGTGIVHGDSRVIEPEYCFNRLLPL